MSDSVDDNEKEAWRKAWDYRAELDREAAEKRASEIRSRRATLHQEAMGLEAELAELEGRGDWTRLMRPLADFGWLHEEAPPRRALLEKDNECVLPMGKVGFFVGEGGVGKSWALTQLAISVATGTSWLQNFNVPEDAVGGVIMAMGEEDPEEMHRRIRHITEHLNLASHNLSDLDKRLWPLPLAGHFMEFLDDGERSFEHERFEQMLRLQAPEDGWKLVILDPASRFMGVDAEKDNAFATRFVQLLERLTSLPGNPTVLCAHHTTKTSRAGGAGARSVAARGASALTDGARWQGNLTPAFDEGAGEFIEDMAVFQISKSNYGPKPAPLYLKRKENSGVLIPTYEPSSRDRYDDQDDSSYFHGAF